MRSAPGSRVSINLSELVAASLVAFEYDEDEHPRDTDGKFAPKEGGDTAARIADAPVGSIDDAKTGEPITIHGYHTTSPHTDLTPEFEEALGRPDVLGPGFYMTDDSSAISAFGGDVQEITVTLLNPYVVETERVDPDDYTDPNDETIMYDAAAQYPDPEALMEQGYDGIVLRGEPVLGEEQREVVVFPGQHPDQIKQRAQTASLVAFEFDEEKHSRDEAGKFAPQEGGDGGGEEKGEAGKVRVAVTQRDMRDALVDTWRGNFERDLGDYPERYAAAKAAGEELPEPEGGAQGIWWREEVGIAQPTSYDEHLAGAFLHDDRQDLASLRANATRQAKEYAPDEVRPEVVANTLEAVGRFEANPYTAGLRERYGMPAVMLAAKTPGQDLDSGETPSGAYSPGERTIRMYENAFERAGEPEPAAWKPLNPDPHQRGATVSGGTKEGVLTHEYGHYIHEQISYEQKTEWKQIYENRKAAYRADDDRIAALPEQQDRIQANYDRTQPVSYYSMNSGRGDYGDIQEGFAETLAATMQPGYDRSAYDPANHEMLAFMERLRDGT